jgi:hypothetical protein
VTYTCHLPLGAWLSGGAHAHPQLEVPLRYLTAPFSSLNLQVESEDEPGEEFEEEKKPTPAKKATPAKKPTPAKRKAKVRRVDRRANS